MCSEQPQTPSLATPAAPDNVPLRDLRLLCLDGGGVRGLSSLYILKQLLEAVDKRNPPKPCNFFNMIGGTSTGGIIAIMLGRLEMSIDDCIDTYTGMMDDVFRKRQHRISIQGKFQARFDTAELERVIKKTICQYSREHHENILMRDSRTTCKVFACAVPSLVANEDSYQFSTYDRDFEPASKLFDTVKVWEVCRATAAASTFFDPIELGPDKQEFIDGATRSNCPIRQLWTEAQIVYGDGFESRISSVVSIGTGESGYKQFGNTPLEVVGTLKTLSTETDAVYRDFKRYHSALDAQKRLYRFNVQRGLEKIGLEDAGSRVVISTMTQMYMYRDDIKPRLKEFREIVLQVDSPSPSVDESLKVHPPYKPLHLSQAFLMLDSGPKYINPNPVENSYWSRLTVDSLILYEKAWRTMADSYDGMVSYAQFHEYFVSLKPRKRDPTNELLKDVWHRLPLGDQEPAGKDLVMAALYMVHMEMTRPSHRPNFKGTKSSSGFSYTRNKFLRHYANWVRCSCECGRLWSFANGGLGLHWDQFQNMGQDCLAEAPVRSRSSRSSILRWRTIFTPNAELQRRRQLHYFGINLKEWNQDQQDDDRIHISTTF